MQGLLVSHDSAAVSDVSSTVLAGRLDACSGGEPRAWARAGGDPKLFAYEVMSGVPGLSLPEQWRVAVLIDEIEDTRVPCQTLPLPFARRA